MNEKEKILKLYTEAAEEAYKVLKNSMEKEYSSESRELFAEMYGRRQAYARVLKEVYDVPGTELQKILDRINEVIN